MTCLTVSHVVLPVMEMVEHNYLNTFSSACSVLLLTMDCLEVLVRTVDCKVIVAFIHAHTHMQTDQPPVALSGQVYATKPNTVKAQALTWSCDCPCY